MEIKGKVFCFFEQSGTFKNEFRKLGIKAEDYDIQNEFGQTDHMTDLFAEIDNAYRGGQSLFDEMTENDLVIAFFPCIYFCENDQLYFNGGHQNLRRLNAKELADTLIERGRNRQRFYELFLEMCTIAKMRGFRLIIENPYSTQHYLVGNLPYKASYIDRDRTKRGDFYKKPTQYWFIGCEPTMGFTPYHQSEHKNIASAKPSGKSGICSETRSLISPIYARNFICDMILGKVQGSSQMQLF